MGVDTIINAIKETFGNFNQVIDQVTQIVTTNPQSNAGMWSVVQAIYNVVLPVSYTLAVLYFIIDFLNKSIMLEYMQWENVVKSLFKLVVCKMILENVMKLMTGVFSVASSLISSIGTVTVQTHNIDYTGLQQTLNSMDFLERTFYYVDLIPLKLIMNLIKIAILVIAYGRMIEIYIYTAWAPIPLSSLASEGLHHTAKRFLQDYSGVCLQGGIIITSCSLYGGLMKNMVIKPGSQGLLSMIMYSLVLLIILVKSGSWAKKLTGGN